MPWLKIDDNMPSHPKWLELQDQHPEQWAASMAIWTVALCYSGRYLTDGLVRLSALRRQTPLDRADIERAADALVDVGLWDRGERPGEYWIHDYLDHNTSRAKHEAKQEAEADRKRKARDMSAKRPRGQIRTGTSRPQMSERTDAPCPRASASPDPTRPDPTRPRDQDIVAASAATHPRKQGLAGDCSPDGPEMPVDMSGVPEGHPDQERPAQGKPDPVEAKPGDFALTPPAPSKALALRARAEAVSRVIVSYLNVKTRRTGAELLKPLSPSNVDLALTLIENKHTVEEAKRVIDAKVAEWQGTDMAKHLKPSTLFKLRNFQRYLAEDVPSAGMTAAQRAPRQSDTRGITGADMLRYLDEQEARNVIDIE